MKKIAIAALTIFFILAILDGMLQSPWVKRKTLSLLSESIQDSGWKIQVENIESTFPKIYLSDATIENDVFSIHFGTLKADLSLIRLLKKEIFLSQVQADKVSWEVKSPTESTNVKGKSVNSPSFILNVHDFDFTNVAIVPNFYANLEGSFHLKSTKRQGIKIRSSGKLYPLLENTLLAKKWDFSVSAIQNVDQSWSIQNSKLKSDDINIKGLINLNQDGTLTHANFQLQTDTIPLESPIPSHFRLLAQVEMQGKEEGIYSSILWRFPSLEIKNQSLKDTNGKIESLYKNGSLKGDLSLFTHFLGSSWEGKTPFSWEQKSSLSFPDISIKAPSATATGNLEIQTDNTTKGSAIFAIEQLHELIDSIYGKAEGKIVWNASNEVQFDCNIADLYYGSISAQSASIHSDLMLPFQDLSGLIVCDIEGGKWGNLILDSASIETQRQGENWPFELTTVGSWRHPLEGTLNGYWNYHPKNLVLSLQNATGSFFNHPILLNSPSYFEWSPNLLQLKDFSLQIADGNLDLFVDRENANGQAKLAIHHLPIDFLSINPLDVDVKGTFSIDVEVEEKEHTLKGNLEAKIEDIEMHLLGNDRPVLAGGEFAGYFDRDFLSLKGALNVQEASLFHLDLKVPIHFEVWPFKADLIYDKEAKGKFYLLGKLEEFLDFVNLGSHRIEGNCLCDLSLSNTLEFPNLYGKCQLSDGYYQNYYTGTELQNITADFIARGNVLELSSFTAEDSQNKGSFGAKGTVQLRPNAKFPYQFDLSFDRFNIATFDLVTSEATGSIQITGNLEEGLARGSLEIMESDINIPTRIPRALPDLQVVYKNAKKPPNIVELASNPTYPLHLDLTVDAPDGIYISGRGLDSEWKGHFVVQGTQTDIATKGKIELIKGNFLFSGREFKLTEGSLTFSGEKNEMPYLNLGANIEVKNVSITAHLKGPLNNPQVVLHSSPPLPMGTIMAYLLFGQDLAEINSFQALQLANSIANLAGEGPGILEQTRKSIGVDRIQIITVPSAKAEGGETIALQVGKYVAEGVLVSFSQGAENDSSNISIEVEAKGGISFLLESDQSQEQGKFTLRWSHTY